MPTGAAGDDRWRPRTAALGAVVLRIVVRQHLSRRVAGLGGASGGDTARVDGREGHVGVLRGCPTEEPAWR